MDSLMVVLVWVGAFGVLLVLFAIAFVRPDLKWSALRARFAFPESQFIALGDGSYVHVRDTGPPEGRVLVLLHGFGASVHTWMGWTQRLARKRRVIALDLRGFGLTSAPFGAGMGAADQVAMVAATLDQMGVKQFSLVGHSMGGGFAWRFALSFPEKVTALILSGAMGRIPDTYQKNINIYQNVARNPLVRLLTPHLMSRYFISRGMVNGFADKALATPARIERAEHLARAPGQRSHLLNMVLTLKRDTDAEKLASLTVPTLIMHGTKDALVPFAAGEELAHIIPGATLLSYPGIGHVLQEEVVEQGAADLETFLNRVEA